MTVRPDRRYLSIHKYFQIAARTITGQMKRGYDLPTEAPGRYRPLREDNPFSKAYFPDPLPPEFTLSDELIGELADAMHALGRLDGLASEVTRPEALFSSFVYKEAESSSQVEGTAVTVSDIYQHDIGEPDQSRPASRSDRDVREAHNYITALNEAIEYLQTAGFERSNITLPLIEQLHETLMDVDRSDEVRPGELRPKLVGIQETNSLGQPTTRFVPPPPTAVERGMADLETYIQSSHAWPDLIDIALIHYQFETIHPFTDGNGRVGRSLIVVMLLCSDLLRAPVLYPSAYFNRQRDEYAHQLLRVSEAGEWEAWLEFFLRGITQQAEEAFVRARLLADRRTAYERRYADAPQSVRRAIEVLFETPYLSVTELADRIDMSYGTANDVIATLEADGVVQEITGQQRDRVFEASEIMEIVERPAERLPDPDAAIEPPTLAE